MAGKSMNGAPGQPPYENAGLKLGADDFFVVVGVAVVV